MGLEAERRREGDALGTDGECDLVQPLLDLAQYDRADLGVTLEVRAAAVDRLRALRPPELAKHPALLAAFEDQVVAAVQKLSRSRGSERMAGLVELFNLDDAGVLAQHSCAVAALLNDKDDAIRTKALMTLGRLSPTALAPHTDVVVATLGAAHFRVRKTALQTLAGLDSARLDAPDPSVSNALIGAVDAIVALLNDTDTDVVEAAMLTMKKLPPKTLCLHIAAIKAKLDDK